MSNNIQHKIDAMPFDKLIRLIRTEPSDSPFFAPENRQHFILALGRKRAAKDSKMRGGR